MVSSHPASLTERPADTVMIWPPGRAQSYGHATARFSHTWIHCDGKLVRRMLRQSGLPVARPFVTTCPGVFEKALDDMYSELVGFACPDVVIVANLLEIALRELSRALAPAAQAAAVPPNVLAVRQLIGTAPAAPLALDDLAAMAGLSVPHFCAVYKECFGLPPMESLIRHRMHHAAHLLGNRNLGVAEVGRQVGYDDAFHFSRMFKKHHGLSPRAYRRRALGG